MFKIDICKIFLHILSLNLLQRFASKNFIIDNTNLCLG